MTNYIREYFQEHLIATDLPPKYDDIVSSDRPDGVGDRMPSDGGGNTGQGHTNLAVTGDSGLPEYDQCIQVGRKVVFCLISTNI